ncbi:MAG TPA: acyltransferase [Rhodopila sp.]|nr:acyltransferase [Rhodopila sp.]
MSIFLEGFQSLISKISSVSADPEARGSAMPDVVDNLDSVRGLACILVVALHVVGVDAATGLRLDMSSPWHYVMTSLEFLRMPLFTALSGYLYAGNRVSRQGFDRFWSKKLQRIGVPLLFVTTLVWILRRFVYHDSGTIFSALFFAYEHLWYLQSLLLIFLTVSVWDSFVRPTWSALLLATLAIIMLAQSVTSLPDFFSFGGAIYLMPYFFFGIVLREQAKVLLTDQIAGIALGIVIIVLITQQFYLNGLANEITLMQLPAALAGMAGVAFLLRRFPRNAQLAAIGRYSYTIYLWHTIFVAGTRMVLVKADVVSHAAVFCAASVMGIAAPIILHIVAARSSMLCLMLTGTRGVPRVRPRGARLVSMGTAGSTIGASILPQGRELPEVGV